MANFFVDDTGSQFSSLTPDRPFDIEGFISGDLDVIYVDEFIIEVSQLSFNNLL